MPRSVILLFGSTVVLIIKSYGPETNSEGHNYLQMPVVFLQFARWASRVVLYNVCAKALGEGQVGTKPCL